MQEYRLDGTANIVLRYRGALVHNHSLNFVDATGRKVLVLAVRSRQVRGQRVVELLLNAVNAQGVWGAELSAEVPETALASGLELRFRSWRIEVLLGQRLRMACNPTASFGPGADPALATGLQTNCQASLLSIQTGVVYDGSAVAEAAVPAGDDITLVLLNSGAPDRLRAAFADLAYRFHEIVILNPEASPAPGQTAAPLPDQVLNAALAQVATPYLAIVSGDWSARDLGLSVAQFAADLGPDSFMPMTVSPVMTPGAFWGLLLPARIGGQPTVTMRGGIMVIDAKLTSAAYWQVSRQWNAADALRMMRQESAFQPLELDATGRVGMPVHRAAIQAYVRVPGGTLKGWPFSGLRLDQRALTGPLTPRRILMPLCIAAEESCASHFMLWTPEAGSMARAAAWLRLGLLDEIGMALGSENRAAGLMISRDLLAPAVLAEIDALDHEAFNQPCADLALAITRLVALITRLDILVVRVSLGALDAHAPRVPQGRLQWLSTGAVIHAQISTETQGVAAQVPASLPGAGKAGAARADTAGAETAGADAEGAFESLALQAIQHGMIWRICQYAIAADLRQPAARFVARLVATFRNSGWADDPELRATFMEALIARNYHDELRPLVAGLLPDPAATDILPELRLRLRSLDVLLRCRDPQDRFYADPAQMRLRDAGGPPPDPGAAAYFLDSLTFYLALRQDWQAILDLVAETRLPDRATPGFCERWVIARIETGQTAGLGADLRDLHLAGRLTAWSFHRLSLRLAHAAGDAIAEQEAVLQLLQGEDAMRPLLAPPTRFRRIGAVAGSATPPEAVLPITVGREDIACIIVARNEFFRLKWLHAYYRQLGVDRFFLIDNGSDDETIDYFARQPDVTILQTDEPYRDSSYGVKWHNEVAEAYLEGRWVLTVDADEALVFDGADAPGALRDLCARLDAEGAEGFFAPMLDMYSQDRLDKTDYLPGDSLIERFPMFDSGEYRLDPTPGYPAFTMSGGVRIRLFWHNRHDQDVPHLAMQKVPLVRWRRGFRYLASTHDMTALKVSAETGALLHFKFMPDFHRRAMEEVRRNQHYEGAREYRIYAEFLADPANRSFVYEGSARYEGPETLIRLGLITPPKDRPKAGAASDKAAAWLQARGAARPVTVAEDAEPALLGEGTARALAGGPASRLRIIRN